jgi:hypothetical protein
VYATVVCMQQWCVCNSGVYATVVCMQQWCVCNSSRHIYVRCHVHAHVQHLLTLAGAASGQIALQNFLNFVLH